MESPVVSEDIVLCFRSCFDLKILSQIERERERDLRCVVLCRLEWVCFLVAFGMLLHGTHW